MNPPSLQQNFRGLYDPSASHDACGVGMICHIRGEPSHRIIRDAVQILENLGHRGAVGCDAATGDGAGILFQVPHKFLKKVCEDIRLPDAKGYGAGMVFLPADPVQRTFCMNQAEAASRECGQVPLGWRKVPVNSGALGHLARLTEPSVYQMIVSRSPRMREERKFERILFKIRKKAEKKVRESDLPQKDLFHIASLSCRTMVYKGMLLADQLRAYFPDLLDPDMESALALVHQRYSTNTFPAWRLAQPFRYLCHNGEINTLRGNVNWMNARERLFRSSPSDPDISWLFPVATPWGSDSAILDNALELLYHTGRSLPHAMMMLIPEAWQRHERMEDEKKAFYQYHACLMEPWDGPASIPFTDGVRVGAVLDRNGLRPSRYTLTRDGYLILASETGVLDIPPDAVALKGRVTPGRMLLADTAQGRIISDEEIKSEIRRRNPYRKWLNVHTLTMDRLPEAPETPVRNAPPLPVLQKAFGYTREDLKIIIDPMARDGKEPVGSMGDDIPLAVLSRQPRLLYDYFKQLFAQVTNPPLDPIREALVTSLSAPAGREKSLMDETPEHCRQLWLDAPILTDGQLARIRAAGPEKISSRTLPMLFPAASGGPGLRESLGRLKEAASDAISEGAEILILSDRGTDPHHMPVPALLAVSAVHHHLIREGTRTRCGLIVETGEAREVHHFCCLIGYGAAAVQPYLVFRTLRERVFEEGPDPGPADRCSNYIHAVNQGILKVMAKMGISTLQSYRGAQLFECVGVDPAVIAAYFPGTVSRLGGADLSVIAEEARLRHEAAFPSVRIPGSDELLPSGGKYQWRRGGESHQYHPEMIAAFQRAVRTGDRSAWDAYSAAVFRQNREEGLLRGLFDFTSDKPPIPVSEAEPWTDIVKRFKTGAISYGSISKEAHETLAIAMNRIGAKSNSGEGGEDPDRFLPDPTGDWRNSAVKQIASGRFGVTAHYLAHADDLQIKMAQGAKPGEGGQLPGFKVYPWIAKTRHCTPYVGLISPPPHHDIYSIEDLAQLIFDLKNANPGARITVKLVSEVGVGTVAAGVAKARADLVLISGDTGGTGASPQGAIRHTGLPWELGLAETQQALVLNGLRSRIRVECDGQLKTGRDIAVACLLGADEFGFGSIALVALGCIMMRVCHLNTCPVGIATQDPELRRKFTGKPEYVIQLMRFLAKDFREIMAGLGFRSVDEMVGRSDCLTARPPEDHWKAGRLDFSLILARPEPPEFLVPACRAAAQDHGIDKVLDAALLPRVLPALENGKPVAIRIDIRNAHRSLGTLISHEIVKRHGDKGLPDDAIVIHADGSAGQSCAAFGAKGLTIHIRGDANDYFGKGLSGARLSIRPPEASGFVPEENILVGNVALYGATSGEAYINGIAGERFCVRNSGAIAVVEGVGDHGCEYMTGGVVVVLGKTGRNFAAGMSGGAAYVLDPDGNFVKHRLNPELVDPEPVQTPEDIETLRTLISTHYRYTKSPAARRILETFDACLPRFVKVMPREYRLALRRITESRLDGDR